MDEGCFGQDAAAPHQQQALIRLASLQYIVVLAGCDSPAADTADVGL